MIVLMMDKLRLVDENVLSGDLFAIVRREISTVRCVNIVDTVPITVGDIHFFILFLSHYQPICTSEDKDKCVHGMELTKKLQEMGKNFIVYPVLKDRSYKSLTLSVRF